MASRFDLNSYFLILISIISQEISKEVDNNSKDYDLERIMRRLDPQTLSSLVNNTHGSDIATDFIHIHNKVLVLLLKDDARLKDIFSTIPALGMREHELQQQSDALEKFFSEISERYRYKHCMYHSPRQAIKQYILVDIAREAVALAGSIRKAKEEPDQINQRISHLKQRIDNNFIVKYRRTVYMVVALILSFFGGELRVGYSREYNELQNAINTFNVAAQPKITTLQNIQSQLKDELVALSDEYRDEEQATPSLASYCSGLGRGRQQSR